MKWQVMLASSLFVFSVGPTTAQMNPVRSGGNTPTGPFGLVDQAIEEAEKTVVELPKCYAAVDAMKRELSNKKKEIARQYGVIPLSYFNLIRMKFARIQRGSLLCSKMESGAQFSLAHNLLGSVEPKSISGFQERRDRIDELESQFNDLIAERKSSSSP